MKLRELIEYLEEREAAYGPDLPVVKSTSDMTEFPTLVLDSIPVQPSVDSTEGDTDG